MIYPKLYLNSVTNITIELLKEHNIKGLILDIDNTLIDFEKNLSIDVVQWAKQLQENGIKMCILSNTNKVEKVKKVAGELKLNYFYFAKKPFKKGFLKAKEYLQLEEEKIAVVGDQIFTDIIGANRCKMFAILVKPIDKRDHLLTRIKRPVENVIIKRFVIKKGGNK